MHTFSTQLHEGLSQSIHTGLLTGTLHARLTTGVLQATITTPAGDYCISDEYGPLSRSFLEPGYLSVYGKTWRAIKQGKAILTLALEGTPDNKDYITLFKPATLLHGAQDDHLNYLESYIPLDEAVVLPDQAVATLTNFSHYNPLPYDTSKSRYYTQSPREIDAATSVHLRRLAIALGIEPPANPGSNEEQVA